MRLTERACLGRIRTWLHAGLRATDGRVIHPDTGTPQGGVVSPVLAHVYVQYAVDRWCAQVVTPRGRGAAVSSRSAEDLVCACRLRSDAAWRYQALPKRLGPCTREVAPQKTRLLRCSRFHPGLPRRFTCVGCAVCWKEDRPGVPRVTRRTARKQRPRACQRSKAWMPANRPGPGNAFCNGLKARLRGHSRYDGVHGTSHALHRVVDWAMQCACTWRNRRGGNRRSCSWTRVTQLLDAVPLARPRMPEPSRRSV